MSGNPESLTDGCRATVGESHEPRLFVGLGPLDHGDA
jgi:hypothetical protein